MSSNVLFYWIPKTGGTSLWTSLESLQNFEAERVVSMKPFSLDAQALTFQHTALSQVYETYGCPRREVIQRFVFSIVRNTYARLVSAWADTIHRSSFYPKIKHIVGKTFPEYVDFATNYDITKITKGYSILSHALPQLDWIEDAERFLGRPLDFIGHTEDMFNVFAVIGKQIDRGLVNYHLNQSSHARYEAYYTPELRKKVEQHYGPEIERFKFKFKG